jgi:hypothetical protein
MKTQTPLCEARVHVGVGQSGASDVVRYETSIDTV